MPSIKPDSATQGATTAPQGSEARSQAPRPGWSSPNDFWKLVRSPANPRDSRLSDLAFAWMKNLPEPLQPLSLCRQYPRIANRLALCWEDPVLTTRVFTQLMDQQRPNRRGFPAEVQRELQALRDQVPPQTDTA
jgi:hypothetical protein